MCLVQHNRKHFIYGRIMLYMFWNKVKGVVKFVLKLKLKFLIWVCCVMIVLFGVLVFQRKNTVHEELPIIVWWTEGFPGTNNEIKTCEDRVCYVTNDVNNITNVSAYLFYGSSIDFNILPLPRKPSEVIWGLYHEESPRNVGYFMHEKALTMYNYSSTFSRYSSVPYTLQYLKSLEDLKSMEYFVSTADKNNMLKEISPVLYIQSDCETMTERDDYVVELMKHISVDSYGECLNNKELPEKFKSNYVNNLDDEQFLSFVARYKFTIAIENGVCDDYITEKFWRALNVGSVPLYLGSPTIRDWMPNTESAILLQDYGSPLNLANYLKILLENDTLYEQHLEHKLKQHISNEKLVEEFSARPFVNDPMATADHFECFVCNKLYDLKKEFQESVMSKKHYDCPKPTSSLWRPDSKKEGSWVTAWKLDKVEIEEVYNKIMKSE